MIFIFSLPEPKVHGWAYSFVRHPSSVRPSTFSNDISSEAMQPILINFHNIYRPGERIMVFFFIPNRIRSLVAMATYSCHWLGIRKVKIGIYCYPTADILIKIIQNCVSSPLSNNLLIWSNPLSLICFHGDKMLSLWNILKKHPLTSHKGDKADFLQSYS